MDKQEIIRKIVPFLEQKGISVRMEKIEADTFLPGVMIRSGILVYDDEKLLYPGDLLHEAGHIAVNDPLTRPALSDNVLETGGDHGEEMAAILWSYAALKKIGLDEHIVFHPAGYKGQSEWYIENFSNGTYIGLPLLQWMGMTADEKKAAELNISPYPHMISWLRQ